MTNHGEHSFLVSFVFYIYLGKLQRPHCDLTIIIVSKGNHPNMALIQGSELL